MFVYSLKNIDNFAIVKELFLFQSKRKVLNEKIKNESVFSVYVGKHVTKCNVGSIKSASEKVRH